MTASEDEMSTTDADPELWAQRKTGRALMRLVLVVGGLQVGGVFLWLALFVAGVVDPTGHLNEFLITQFAVFVTSLIAGIGWVIVYIRNIEAEAEAMLEK